MDVGEVCGVGCLGCGCERGAVIAALGVDGSSGMYEFEELLL